MYSEALHNEDNEKRCRRASMIIQLPPHTTCLKSRSAHWSSLAITWTSFDSSG